MGEAQAIRAALTVLDGLLAVLVAPECAACHKPLDHPTRGPVCDACWESITPITPPVCDRCGDPLPSWRRISLEEACCARCRRGGSRVARCRAIGPYEGGLRDIVHALKYDGRRTLARRLAEMLARSGAEVLDGADLAVPVPLHRSRLGERGFNQAAEIASCLGLPVAHALRRVRATPSQTDLPAAKRHANVRGAFAVRRRVQIPGLTVVRNDVVVLRRTLWGLASLISKTRLRPRLRRSAS